MAQLFKTLRWLRPYASKSGQQIFIRVRMHSGIETNIPVYDFVNHEKIPISVKKENWEKGFVTGGKYHISIRDLNNLLSNVEHNVKDAVNELLEKNIKISVENVFKLTYINELTAEENNRRISKGDIIVDEQGGAFASHEEFVEFIEESEDTKFTALKKSMGLFKKEYILDYWEDFITDYAPDSYNSPRYVIDEYIRNTGDNCKANEFSSDWLNRFFKHIIDNGYSQRKDGKCRKDFSITTVSKYQRHLRSFGDFLFEENVINNQNYRKFSVKGSRKKQSLIKYDAVPYINTHALYKRELDWFFAFEFEDKDLSFGRDLFILQVWLGGLRISDFSKLSRNNLQKDPYGNYKILFKQEKTDDDVNHTVNKNYLIPILDKYPNGLPDFPRVRDYHTFLRKATKQAGLIRELKFRGETAKDADATTKWYPIHERICNKWARNCAVSILAELGYPDDRISKFTGHRDIEMIKHYKQIHGKDVTAMVDVDTPE